MQSLSQAAWPRLGALSKVVRPEQPVPGLRPALKEGRGWCCEVRMEDWRQKATHKAPVGTWALYKAASAQMGSQSTVASTPQGNTPEGWPPPLPAKEGLPSSPGWTQRQPQSRSLFRLPGQRRVGLEPEPQACGWSWRPVRFRAQGYPCPAACLPSAPPQLQATFITSVWLWAAPGYLKGRHQGMPRSAQPISQRW